MAGMGQRFFLLTQINSSEWSLDFMIYWTLYPATTSLYSVLIEASFSERKIDCTSPRRESFFLVDCARV